jgi:hypothetical protein
MEVCAEGGNFQMTQQANYTPNEWQVLNNAPLYAAGAVAASASSGFVGTVKEGAAIVNGMMRAANKHPNNQLIREIAPSGIDTSQMDSWAHTVQNLVKGESESTRVKTEGLNLCRQAAQILQMKAPPQEAEDYKHWILEIGEEVANAANEGGNFFNVGGTRLSQQESQMLRDIASALGTQPS